jgi:DNA-binding NarL/FixJ family response regulator
MSVVLVVDPLAQTSQRVAQALVGTRLEIRTARDPTDAEVILDREVVSAVFTAVVLPGGNPYDLTRSVHARHPEAAVFLVSGGFDVVNHERAAEAGIAGRLSRPFTSEAVRRALEGALGPLTGDPSAESSELGEETLDPASVEALGEVESQLLQSTLPMAGPAVAAAPRLVTAPEPLAAPPIADERRASFLPRDWRTLPPVQVDPEVVGPAMERAILAILPEVVEILLNKAITTSPAFREMVEVAVEAALREELPGIARKVIRERMAEIERGDG